MLDLEAELFSAHLAEIAGWLPIEHPVEIVDLGCGTGAGTFALLERFADARVLAVDASPEHLRRLDRNAAERGLSARVKTIAADLDADWPDLGTPDLIWASSSLHHLGDPERALRRARTVLSPSGLVAVVELAGTERVLPEGTFAGVAGLEGRILSAAGRRHAAEPLHRGDDWGRTLAAAGFAIVDKRLVDVHIDPSQAPLGAVNRYAYLRLQRMRQAAGAVSSPEDLAALDRLLDRDRSESVLRRSDLAVRTQRSVWVARPLDR